MLNIELKNFFNRKEFKFIFALLCIISVGSYLFIAILYNDYGIRWLRSAYDCSIMVNPAVSTLYSTFVILLPIIVGFIYSDSYYNDRKNGRQNYICTRYSEAKYIRSQSLSVAIMSFCTITIPLLINFLLCQFTFPKTGMDNNYSLPPYDIGIQNYSPTYWMDTLRIENAAIYSLLRILIVGFVSMSIALIIYGLYTIEKISEKNKFLPIILVFALFITNDILFTYINKPQYSITSLLYSECEGVGYMFAIYLAALPLAAFILIGAKIIRVKYGRSDTK